MKILSFDAETDGLWGKSFSIAAIVYEEQQGQLIETARFVARCMADIQNEWVMTNVLPLIRDIEVTHASYKDMLLDFSIFYMQHKNGADCVVHMGYIVEAGLLRDMWQCEFIDDFDGPYPLYDVSGNLQQAGEDPISVDAYAKKHGLEIADYGTTHHPLYDCEVTAKVYYHLKNCRL